MSKNLRVVEEFDSTIKWINKEETLFKFPISVYPLFEEVKVSGFVLIVVIFNFSVCSTYLR